MSEVTRLQVRVPKFVKKWCDANGYSASDLLRIGLSFSANYDDILKLSFLRPNYRTTISLPKELSEKLQDIVETLGIARDRAVSAICTYTIFKLDNSDVIIDKIVKSLSSYSSVWTKLHDEVEQLKLYENEILSELNGETNLKDVVKLISSKYDVSPISAKLFIFDMANEGKLLIMNGVVKSVRVCE